MLGESTEGTASAQPSTSVDRSELEQIENFASGSQPATPEPPAKATKPDPTADAGATAQLEATGEEPSETPTAQTPEPERKYKVRGREYTLAELTGKPELFEAIITTAEQFPHIQRLRDQERKEYMQLIEKLAGGAQPQGQPQQTVPTPAQFRAAYEPRVQDLVKTGYIEEQAAELMPNFVAQGIALADRLVQVETALANITQFVGQTRQGQQEQSAEQQLDGFADSLAAKGDLFKPLADKTERRGFYEFLARDVNPQLSSINEEFMARMYVAYKKDELAEAVRQAQQQTKVVAETKRRHSVGEGGAPRAPQTQMTDLERELREMEAAGH